MIKIEKLNKKFGKLEVLKDLNLEIRKGSINAILGPNGSGKTTLIKCLLGMVIPDNGSIKINGSEVKDQWKYRDEIDYMPQIANFPANLKVKEIISMMKDIRNREARDAELIEYFELSPYLPVVERRIQIMVEGVPSPSYFSLHTSSCHLKPPTFDPVE